MTKGKKIGILIAIILGVIVLVVGTFTKPNQPKASGSSETYAKSQIEKLNQLQQLTSQLYKDEETTDMAQLKSEITQVSGSQESLYNGMLSDLENAKSQIGQKKYDEIKSILVNNVNPSYNNVINDAKAIAAKGYDENPGQTVENYQNAMKAINSAENAVTGVQESNQN
ncbi:MAG: hypothetical protein ACRC41_14730 [Sarcina sp.]